MVFVGIDVHKRYASYGSKTNLRGKWVSGSLSIVVADDTPEHVPIADRTLG
jgi:hypothetical protein